MLSELNLPEDIKRDISVAAEILMQEGCKEVYLFGSLAEGSVARGSDIDLATVGLPKERFFAAYGRILSNVRRRVDLVGLDYDHDFGNRLREVGTLLRVA
jgi:predicted nucleotidyltransferase